MADGYFEPAMLPDAAKRELCEGLLAEFGARVSHVRVQDHELIHGCLIPGMGHTRQDTDPSASLNWDKLTYKCLGCGSKGGLLWFIQTVRGGDWHEAKEWLSTATGTGMVVQSLPDLMAFFDALYAPKADRYPPIPQYDERAIRAWDVIHPYLTDEPEFVERDGVMVNVGGRGIPEANVVALRLGYAPDYPVRGGGTSERITVPAWHHGTLVGWQTRRLSADGTPKYLASPDFPRDQVLFDPPADRSLLVWVESALSVARHRHALPMCGTWGSMSELQVRMVCRYDRVVLFPDSDPASWKAVEGVPAEKGKTASPGIAEEISRNTELVVVENPYAQDAGELPTELVAQMVRDAIPYGLWKRPAELMQWRG